VPANRNDTAKYEDRVRQQARNMPANN